MSKPLNQILSELGYETRPSDTQGKKEIYKGDKHLGTMSAGQVWNHLRHEHPEVFEKEGNQ